MVGLLPGPREWPLKINLCTGVKSKMIGVWKGEMMKKRIVILSNRIESGNAMKDQLSRLFGDLFKVDCYSIETEIDSVIVADLVLSLSYQIVSSFINHLGPNSDIFIVRCTVEREGWNKVMQLQPGTKAYVISDLDNASITVATLYELGAQHVELLPYNSNFEPDAEIKVAIVMNDGVEIPMGIDRVINIGERVLDSYTLFDILGKLGQLNERTSNIIINHMGEIIPRSSGFLSIIGNIRGDVEYFQNAINTFEEGFILFNPEGTILLFNTRAEIIFKKDSFNAIGRSLNDVLNEVGLDLLIGDEPIKEKMEFNNSSYIFVKQFSNGPKEHNGGCIRIISPSSFNSFENIKIFESQGHKSKYEFENIVSNSEIMKTTIKMAKVISRSDSDVIIYGETGSGKELFAHSIHKNSDRGNYPFVAFNCAAVSDSLIASELFGYVDGAFTGARKGGRKGLFEVANNGTLFLDEIGEISFGFQANLLRVLQEREIVRVGSSKIIPVNIRIIAATNRDLANMVHEGKFRADLYYRLNVMRLKIPPLRERPEDIPYLISHFLKSSSAMMDIPKLIMDQMTHYHWPGNIRELSNCIEYIVNMHKGNVEIDSLPEDMVMSIPQTSLEDCNDGLKDVHLDLMKLINELRHQKNISSGRRSLVSAMKKLDYDLTENEIRHILNHLSGLGMVEINLGRSGTKLTVTGRKRIESYNKWVK